MEKRTEIKKAILVVSFGSSHLDTLEKNIDKIEQQIRDTFTDYRVYRAFTSQMILRKLKKVENLHFFTVKEAMEQMAEDGICLLYTSVFKQALAVEC